MDKEENDSILRPTCDARDQSLALGGAGGVDEVGDWRTIDSAPRDGANFLAYQDGMIVVGHYWDCAGAALFSMSHVGGYECEEDVAAPTHWMPLPKPPQTPT